MLSDASSADPHLAEALAGGEFRRKVLERLVVMGMTVAEAMEERAAHGTESRHCPGKAFAAVSRAVRLTLAQHAVTESNILAMRKGVFVPVMNTPERSAAAPILPRPIGRVRRLVHDAVREAIEREVGDEEIASEARERLDERLIEREDYTAFLSLPFRDCVNAICDDLGLKFDWRRDTVMAGFVEPDRPATSARENKPGRTVDLQVGPFNANPSAGPGLAEVAMNGPALSSPYGSHVPESVFAGERRLE